MDLSLENVQRTMIQRYQPTTREPARTPFEAFQHKEFGGQYLAEVFHENTKIRSVDQWTLGRSTMRFSDDQGLQVAQAMIEPDYPGRPTVELPEPDGLDARLGEVLRSRRSFRSFTGDGVTVRELSTLLGHSCGVTGSEPIDADGKLDPDLAKDFRAYPSPGALYPVELYVAVLHGGEGLRPGLYFYNPVEHVLRALTEGADEPIRERLPDSLGGDGVSIGEASVVVFLVGAFWRCLAKYGNLGYRFVLEEAGIVTQNLLLVGTGMGLGGLPYAAFLDDEADDLLDLDGVEESVILSVPLGPLPGEAGDAGRGADDG